ncbi:Maf family protein [Marinimicrobium alkaliphilum]|uniref:Maf family protein n=1 Tax=Marinimicrobium alkaliphilum TaxID=2202654 RepID=UPI000DB9F7A9|nr:Maf family protein [Marinimicrobium alkaliphilum]
MTIDLYLASRSPRRRELLRQIGVRHATLPVAVPEVPAVGESPEDYVCRLAREKAQAGLEASARAGLAERPVLGADTLGVCQGRILEKPADAEASLKMLRAMSGATHQVLSAVALATPERVDVGLSITDVDFRLLSDEEIRAYWDTGEPRDKAGSYAIQGLGAAFVTGLRGSYSGVVGLPLEVTLPLLREFGVPWWQEPDDE